MSSLNISTIRLLILSALKNSEIYIYNTDAKQADTIIFVLQLAKIIFFPMIV